ncbi:MAG: cell envelope integrity protein TolA [Bdellovibrionota bacterium]
MLQNKISEPEAQAKTATFERSLVYSGLFHAALVLMVLGFNKFNVSIFKKPPMQATVMWAQSVKRPKPTIKDKLPPPLVPIKKAEEAPKKDEINVKKEPEVKTKEESAKDRMKKALEAMKSKVVPEDDRPAPKEDNFASAEENKEGMFSDTEVMAIQNSSEFGAYQALVKQTVNDNFIWYKTGNFSTIVHMKIDPQGNVTNVKIEKSSGDFGFDQAVLRAVQRSSPLPLPTTEKILKYVLHDYFEFEFERKN